MNRDLITAVLMNDFAAVRELVSKGADVNTHEVEDRGETPLILAASFGSREMVEYLLQQGADPNDQADTGSSVVMYAGVDLLTLLRDHGADLNIRDNDDETPLMRAAQGGHMDKVVWLLENGADSKAVDVGGHTALYHAESFGFVYVADVLRKAMEAANRWAELQRLE